MKSCTICKRAKNSSEYPKDKSKPDGLHPRGASCRSEYDKARYIQKRDKIKEATRAWAQANRERANALKSNKENIKKRNKVAG